LACGDHVAVQYFDHGSFSQLPSSTIMTIGSIDFIMVIGFFDSFKVARRSMGHFVYLLVYTDLGLWKK
jgi:DMSO/TMAO reductase YedYZ heme-binding membrane subunit